MKLKALIYVSAVFIKIWLCVAALIAVCFSYSHWLNIAVLLLGLVLPGLLVFRLGMNVILPWRMMWRLRVQFTSLNEMTAYLKTCYPGFNEKRTKKVLERLTKVNLAKNKSTSEGNENDSQWKLTDQGCDFLQTMTKALLWFIAFSFMISAFIFVECKNIDTQMIAIALSLIATALVFLTLLFFDEVDNMLTSIVTVFSKKDPIYGEAVSIS